MPHDVFAYHDGVIDQHANRQRQTQQGHEVQCETRQPDSNERGNGRSGQRQCSDQSGAPGVQEGIDDQDGESGTEYQRFDHIEQVDACLFATVLRDG